VEQFDSLFVKRMVADRLTVTASLQDSDAKSVICRRNWFISCTIPA